MTSAYLERPIRTLAEARTMTEPTATAPETAAERDRLVKDRDSWKMLANSTNVRCDRLVKVNERLFEALEKLRDEWCKTVCIKLDAGGHDHWEECEQATAILDEARKS